MYHVEPAMVRDVVMKRRFLKRRGRGLVRD